MTRSKRVSVMLAVGLTAVSVTSLALAQTTSPRGASAADTPSAAPDARHAALRHAPARARERQGGVFPVKGAVDYGEGGAQYGSDRGGRMHEGQDVFAPAGTPLVALRAGEVIETGNDGGRGNYVAIFDPRAGHTYLYLHMQSPSKVEPGERVSAGQSLGAVGCTGSCFGDHLHFEVRDGRSPEAPPRDPRPLLAKLER